MTNNLFSITAKKVCNCQFCRTKIYKERKFNRVISKTYSKEQALDDISIDISIWKDEQELCNDCYKKRRGMTNNVFSTISNKSNNYNRSKK